MKISHLLSPNHFLYYFLLLELFLLNIIHCYYIFPFKYFRQDLSALYKRYSNISQEEIFLAYINSISIYTLIKLDNNHIYEMFFKSKEKCTIISDDNCISDYSNFPKNNYLYTNISQIIDFINKNNLSNQCLRGEIGLALPGYSSKESCYPLVNEIKANDNSSTIQVWSIKYYNSSKKKDYVGEIVIGIEPHEYEPFSYNQSEYLSIYNHINEDYYNDEWSSSHVGFSLEFEKVYFYNNSNKETIDIKATDSREASLEFDLGMIKCPFIYYVLIKEHFFNMYLDLNICKEIFFSESFHSFICYKNKLNVKVDKFYESFPTIYFFSYHLNYTFCLTGNDLFLEKDDKLFFMIFSRNENINNWRFGEIFLKKYFFTFNHDSKKIGFYIQKSQENDDNEKVDNKKSKRKKKINFSIIILIVGIIVLILEIGFCFYCFNQKCFQNNRKKRANELNDDNYDYSTVNNN